MQKPKSIPNLNSGGLGMPGCLGIYRPSTLYPLGLTERWFALCWFALCRLTIGWLAVCRIAVLGHAIGRVAVNRTRLLLGRLSFCKEKLKRCWYAGSSCCGNRSNLSLGYGCFFTRQVFTYRNITAGCLSLKRT